MFLLLHIRYVLLVVILLILQMLLIVLLMVIYNENLVINKSVIIQSVSGADYTVINASNSSNYVIEITSDNVTVDGFNITGLANTGQNIGTVMIQGKDYCTITNNILDNNYNDGINLFATGGEYSDNNTVSNNLIINPNQPSGGGGFAIKIKGSDNVINNNTISDGWRWAIHLWSYDTSETISPDRNEITNNIITGTGAYDERGIVCKTGAYTKVTGNTITGIIYAPIYFYTSDRIVGETDFDPRPNHCTVSNNIITGGEAGIALLEGCNNFTISGNTITGGTVQGKITQAGILVGLSRWAGDWVGKTLGYNGDTNYLNYLQVTDNNISGNTITDCGHGIAMQYADRNTLTSNIITDNTGTSAIDWWSINAELEFTADYAGIYFDANSVDNVVNYNQIYDNAGGLKNANTGTTLNARYNWWGCAEGAGESGCDYVSLNVDSTLWCIDSGCSYFYGTYSLSGHVLDSVGSALADATVQIAEGSSTTSNASGFYSVSATSGTYTVYAVKSGYYRQIKSIGLYENTTQNFTLSAPGYTVSDVDDIIVDVVGYAIVEVKDDTPTLIDLGVLYIIIVILLMVVGAVITMFVIVPKVVGGTKKKR